MQEQVHVIVHHSEPSAVDGKDINEFPETFFDPHFPVGALVSTKEGLADDRETQ